MTNEVLQCCYTNASKEIGGKISSGWQAVAVSTNIPSEAYTNCVKLQSANSNIQNKMVDERGNVLNLFEITGDGEYLYISRTQYGLLDRLGRANMFSHAFIFPCKDIAFISDPNNFLTIANENYKDNEEEASSKTEGIIHTSPFDLEVVLKACELSDDNYLTLMQCVYTQYSNKKTAKPLHIQYDGTETNMRNLLFCIYSALPLSIRRNLSVASNVTDNSVGKNLVFSMDAKAQGTYVIPCTGENNILTPRIERKISRLGFVDFIAKNHLTVDEPEYFHILEEKAIELGDTSASNELILKIAHQLQSEFDLNTIDNSELDVRLSDALRSKSLGSQSMDKYIATLLDEITARELFLTEVNEESLTARQELSKTKVLAEAAKKYDFYRFSILPTEEAATKLSKMTSSVFRQYCQKLAKSLEGLKILDYYYSEIALADSEVTWKLLEQVLRDTAFMGRRSKTEDKVEELAWELYYSTIKNGISLPKFDILKTYDAYMNLMKLVLPSDSVMGCGNAAKDAFWELMELSTVEFSAYSEYEAMRVKDDKCVSILDYCKLPRVLITQSDVEFVRAGCRFFIDNIGKFSSEELELGRKRLIKHIESHNMNMDFIDWYYFYFSLPSKELIKVLGGVNESIFNEDMESLFHSYGEFSKQWTYFSGERQLLKTLSAFLIDKCIQIDTKQNPVSLDIWLLLAENVYVNSFELFDKFKPGILYVDSDVAIADCLWIENHKYIHDAKKYINEKGEESKRVKRWLTEIKKATSPGSFISSLARGFRDKTTRKK